jgi:NADPH:quinone reductase
VDVVFDGVGGAVGRAAFELVRPGGRFSAFGLASGTFTDISEADAARRGVTVIRGMRLEPERLRELSRAALAEAKAGRLRPLIGQTFPLERAAEAHAAIEARATVGKTLLLIDTR